MKENQISRQNPEMTGHGALLFGALMWVLFLGGCAAVGPDYRAPEPEVLPEWSTAAEEQAVNPDAAAADAWWTDFNDPLLNRYMEAAAQSNLDVLTALARIEEAEARLGIAGGEMYPEVGAEAGVLHTKTSENVPGNRVEETYYAPNVGARWEIDLFGRIRRSVEAATADYQATREEYRGVMVSLYGRVARTYLDIRTSQARLATAGANITSQRELLALTRSRFVHGLATDLDIAQAERLLARAEAEIPTLKVALSQGINNLSVLLGLMPGELHEELKEPQPIPLPPEQAAVGIPAELLRNRPDIRRAERELAAETARIGVATADLYPSFSLSGVFGFESIDTGDLFDAGSRVFTFGPSLRWQVFEGNRIRNRIKAQDALTSQALLRYEQTVLNGVLEVENNLKAYVEDRARLVALERSARAAQKSVRLSAKLYREGLVDFQPVLDAQRDQLDYENQLAVARGDSAFNFALLCTSLGAGVHPGRGKENGNRQER